MKTWRLLLLFGIMSLISCGEKKLPPKQVCLLYDLSESTNMSEIRQAYVATTRTILKKMKPGDVLLAALITERSISELHFGLQYEFPRFNPTTDNILIERKEKEIFEKQLMQVKDSLLHIADSLLTHPPRRIMKTEILSALQVVEQVFKSYPQPRKILVINSDMIEDSDFYNFTRENLTAKHIAQIIEAEKAARRVPDLSGVKVYVVGAMAQRTQRFLQIRDFWMAYFQACGATVSEQNYGPILIRFEE